jgi:oxidase EvaA
VTAHQNAPSRSLRIDRALERSLSERTVTNETVADWLDTVKADGDFSVEERSLEELAGWHVDPDSGDIAHDTGRFFTIQGVDVTVTANGEASQWRQPVIVQSDVGILGLIASERDGVMQFLVQAKMEPGNRRLVQVSPTVQATSSNFQRIHQGNPTAYLEHFQHAHDHPGFVSALVDQLQTEQANRYLRKRNLNSIVVAEEAAVGEVDPKFRWLTLADLIGLADGFDLLHMDTRSILGSVPFGGPAHPHVDLSRIDAWVAEQVATTRVRTALVPLNDVPGWQRAAGRLHGPDPAPFDVIGVRVTASQREVTSWDQPLVRNSPGTGGTLVVRRNRSGTEVLLSTLTGLGVRNCIEIGPTVVDWPAGEHDVPLSDDFAARALAESGVTLLDNDLPEEGGRFFHSSARHRIVDVTSAVTGATPPGRLWVSLPELRAVAARSSILNMELRSLLACLPASHRTPA